MIPSKEDIFRTSVAYSKMGFNDARLEQWRERFAMHGYPASPNPLEQAAIELIREKDDRLQ